MQRNRRRGIHFTQGIAGWGPPRPQRPVRHRTYGLERVYLPHEVRLSAFDADSSERPTKGALVLPSSERHQLTSPNVTKSSGREWLVTSPRRGSGFEDPIDRSAASYLTA